MKKLFLFSLAVLCSAMTFAQNDGRIHPDEATYKIEGDFSARLVNKKPVYELQNVKATGIEIEKKAVYAGTQEGNQGEVSFTFDKIKTGPDFPSYGFDNISYWYFDPMLNEWQPDIEIRKSERTTGTAKVMTIMLVLDCSNSIGSDFGVVKQSAISFLDRICQASNTGNIHVGIIGFSSLAETKAQLYDMRPLTYSTLSGMKTFISALRPANGTAMYYALDMAIEHSIAHAHQLSEEQYMGSCILTFTDGIDQTSQAFDKEILNADAYYSYVQSKVLDKRIYNKSFSHYIRFVAGKDITSTRIQEKYEDILRSLSRGMGNYRRLNNFNELPKEFEEIAKNLIESWQVLNCYVAPARQGRVCWTFGRKVAKPTPIPNDPPKKEPKKGRNVFLGFNGTVGVPMAMSTSNESYSYYDGYSYRHGSSEYFAMGINIQLGVDFAWPITDRFAIGSYLNIGGGGAIGFTNQTDSPGCFDFRVGLLMLAGDVNEKPFIFGITPCTGYGFVREKGYVPLGLRFGRVCTKHFYVTGNLDAGIPIDGAFILTPSISLGYHFGDKIQSQR